MSRRFIINSIIVTLLAIMTGIILYKTLYLKQNLDLIIPKQSYKVNLDMSYKGYGADILIKTFIPETEGGQSIIPLKNIGERSIYKETRSGDSTFAVWENHSFTGDNRIEYSYLVQSSKIEYTLPDNMVISKADDSLKRYLRNTETIQVSSSEVKDLAKRLLDKNNLLEPTLKNIYDYILDMENKDFKGTTDALTALKLGEASCNGKSRLFVALTRNLGIPSRLVGGLILNNGTKKTTHQWVEVYVNGYWIPFDTLNAHYMYKPQNYLVLYRGDEVMFKYSRDINFDYKYTIKEELSTPVDFERHLGNSNINLYSFLRSFKNIDISIDLLRLILMIPIGVLVVVISRNIIGISTFGTFLPALISVSFRETGLLPGIIAIVFTLIVVSTIRYPLQKLGILHTPKLAIMMIAVITSIILLVIIAEITNSPVLSTIGSATLFPIAILTITTERVAISIEEDGFIKTLQLSLNTILVTCCSYLLINSMVLQSLILGFPEIILGVTALNLMIGSWIGIRVTELVRFKSLLKEEWNNFG